MKLNDLPINNLQHYGLRLVLLVLIACSLCAPAFAGSPPHESSDALRAKAEQGDAAAQAELGSRYYQIDRNYPEALKWFRKAAEQGNARGESYLGTMYYTGRNVAQNYAEAAKWFKKAADQGDDHAQRMLAQMYASGEGVPRDNAESKKWSEKVNARQPPDWGKYIILSFLGIICLILTFFVRKMIAGKKSLYVHAVGVLLVLNSIDTYGFPVLFSKCSGSIGPTDCYKYGAAAPFLSILGGWCTVNLLLRFMMMIGFALDFLAIWYLIHIGQIVFRRRASKKAPSDQGL